MGKMEEDTKASKTNVYVVYIQYGLSVSTLFKTYNLNAVNKKVKNNQ